MLRRPEAARGYALAMPSSPAPEAAGGPALEPLTPATGSLTAEQLVEQLGLWERSPAHPGRPRLLLNMVSTADGRATLGGRSGTISGAADRALFHALRAPVDGVLVGAGTIRTERYGRLITDPAVRALRAERGLPPEPLACIVSGRLALDGDTPLLQEPEARVAILTSSAASLPPGGASVEYVRPGAGQGQLDLAAALHELAERFAIRTLLCEGGPHLARELLAAGLLDELFLSLSPLLAGGEPAGGEALRILAGTELDPPATLELLDVQRSDSYLFLRYGVSAAERVSRETTDSSSLAS
jgi:riboflavin biosynthesis pyrimidine reductase